MPNVNVKPSDILGIVPPMELSVHGFEPEDRFYARVLC